MPLAHEISLECETAVRTVLVACGVGRLLGQLLGSSVTVSAERRSSTRLHRQIRHTVQAEHNLSINDALGILVADRVTGDADVAAVERRSAVDLALGVAVDGPVARLALIETGNGAHGVIDESVVDLAEDPIARLTETVVGTSRSLADQYHRLVATRLCWSDQDLANQLRQVLDDSGVQNVAVVSDSEAATAMASLPLAVPDDPDFAIARGAALDAATGRLSYPAGDATALAPVPPTGPLSPQAGEDTMASAAAPMTEAFSESEVATRVAASEPQLAYSMEDDDSELLPMEYGGDDDEELDAAAAPAGRALLVGSAAGGMLVAGIAALAVAVTIGVRPTAATHPQPPAPAQQKSVPGNFVPALPAPNPVPAPVVQPPPALVPDAGVPQGGPGPAVGGGGGPDQVLPPAPVPPPDVGPPPAPG